MESMLALITLCLSMPFDEGTGSSVPKERQGGVEFELRAFLWGGYQGNSRIRSMEEQTIGLADKGQGSLLHFSDVDAAGPAFAPEIQGTVRFGPHAIRVDFLYSEVKGSTVLTETIAWNGDIHPAGEPIRSQFTMTWLEARYAYEILSGPVELWLGGGIMYGDWHGTINGGAFNSGEFITAFFLPVPSLEMKWRLSSTLTLDAEIMALYGITPRQGVSLNENLNGVFKLTARVDWAIGPVVASAALGYWGMDSVSLEHHDEADMVNWRYPAFELGIGVRF